jgi:hypothetical protein
MSRIAILLIFLVLILVASGFTIRELFSSPSKQNTIGETVKYYRIKDTLAYNDPSLSLLQTMMDVVNPNIFVKADRYYDATFVLFETLNSIDILLQKVNLPGNIKFIYGVRGSDMLASKSMLADILRSSTLSSKTTAARYLPKSYILDEGKELGQLIKEFDPTDVYILKKNIQRQEGNTLSNNLDDIMQIAKETVIAQVMLQDPYIINGRKINLRVYLLVIVDPNNHVSMYLFNNGFVYYTPELFKARSMKAGESITTGYMDRSVYADNPLEFTDLQKHMKKVGDNFAILFNNMLEMMKWVCGVYQPILKEQNAGIPGTKFLIYGCDVAPNAKLDVKLMEINKGPDLSYKDSRDKNLKSMMVDEVFNIVGINAEHQTEARNFINLL